MVGATIAVTGGAWLQSRRGLAWPAYAPETYTYSIGEIAHSLSQLCRFVGQCTRFYSVCEHSVRVANEVIASGITDPAVIRGALLHDSPESFLGDMPHEQRTVP